VVHRGRRGRDKGGDRDGVLKGGGVESKGEGESGGELGEGQRG